MFLNHGSFGACPRPVFDEYQRWQRELERQPVEFLARRYPELIEEAKTRLATYLGARPDDLVFVPNATAGMNVVARSLELGRGDEVCSRTTSTAPSTSSGSTSARGPARRSSGGRSSPGSGLVDELWSGVTPRTRVISVSHITSATALRFPVEEICRRARRDGILVAVDGAHAPGQVDLDLESLGADFYAGNCHKWLCAPKGAGFLWARPEHQAGLAPLVVGWSERELGLRCQAPLAGHVRPGGVSVRAVRDRLPRRARLGRSTRRLPRRSPRRRRRAWPPSGSGRSRRTSPGSARWSPPSCPSATSPG